MAGMYNENIDAFDYYVGGYIRYDGCFPASEDMGARGSLNGPPRGRHLWDGRPSMLTHSALGSQAHRVFRAICARSLNCRSGCLNLETSRVNAKNMPHGAEHRRKNEAQPR